MAKRGAPEFDWSAGIEEEIFTRLIGGQSLREICSVDRDDFLPSETTVYKRLSKDAEFAERYARARIAQAHREAEEIKSIADQATNEDYNVARLRIDARKWRASKMAPKVYGDKLDIETKGSLTVTIASHDSDL